MAKMKNTKETRETRERTQPEGKLLLDDVWLNMGQNALQHITRSCMRDFGHKPSLEDFRQLLNVMLCARLEEYFTDGATVQITNVVFKTKRKRPPQQHKKGDVFAIPLGNRRYAFGRVLRIKPRFGVLIEIFRKTASRRIYHPSIVTSGPLFNPVIVSGMDTLECWRWTVIRSDPGYRLSKAHAHLEFVYPPHPRFGRSAANPFDRKPKYRQITEEEARNMESPALYDPEDIEQRIREALKK